MTSTAMSLRAHLESVLSDDPAPAHVRSLIALFHALAIVCLRGRVRSGNHHPSTSGLPIEDLAFDCLGSLFERDAPGRYRLLRRYYSEAGWARMNDPELLSCTRRLVFSRVHQELCRLWKQGDPSLQKLLRNLKVALRTNRRLVARRIGHDPWLFVSHSVDQAATLPEMSPEYFEAQLIPLLQTGMSMRKVTNAVITVLDDQTWYLKGLPLITIALGIRNSFARLAAALPAVTQESFPEDRQPLLKTALRTIEARMTSAYVGTGKIDHQTLGVYLRSAFDILYDQYVLGNGEGRTFYEYLCIHRPHTTRSEYRQRHQGYLEYLVRLTKREFFASLRKEIHRENFPQ